MPYYTVKEGADPLVTDVQGIPCFELILGKSASSSKKEVNA